MSSRQTLLFWTLMLAAGGLLAGLVGGLAAGLAVALLGLLAVFALHLSQLETLDRWLQEPEHEPPAGSGVWEGVFTRLSRLRRNHNLAVARLERTVARFESAGQAIPDGVIAIDRERRISWMNDLAADHFGLDRQRDRDNLVTHLIRDPEFRHYINLPQHDEPLLLRPAHRPSLALQVFVVGFAGEQTLILSRDVSDRERVERMRRDFVANVSHELRTPLTVVGGFIETLRDLGKDAAKMLPDVLPLLENQTQRMQNLVADLLTLAQLENTPGEPPLAPVGAPGLVASLIEDARALSGGRHHISAEVDADCELLGAAGEVRSIFSNLLSNAVRYTPEGGSIEVRWEKTGEGDAAGCRLSVRDSGPGIAAEHLPRLTERFYRVDGGRSRETGGTGLGLAIVKHALTRHEGWLEIDSEVGRGSTFAANFPPRRTRIGKASAPRARHQKQAKAALDQVDGA